MTLLSFDDVRVLLGGNPPPSRRSITRWIARGMFPRPVYIGARRLARFRRSDLRAYLLALGNKNSEIPPRRVHPGEFHQ